VRLLGATKFEFRLRMTIMVVVVALGFWSPWIEAWGWGVRVSLFEWAALELSRTRLIGFTAAVPVVIFAASLLAAMAVVLRVWGTAYLGPGVVTSAEMQAGAVLADGPYRLVRNPLYLGTWSMAAAMSFAMPATGALFAMAVLTVFLLRLIGGEEAFLAARLGEPYVAYLRAVPRLLPRLRTTLPPAGRAPHWGKALISEINPIGVFIVVAFLSWSYDSRLVVRGILVSFGISLLVRAAAPQIRRENA
jgi:protein-S-isoprenylcysteine O-methyltransferase Ste14